MNNNKIINIILSILCLGLIGYIVYDKVSTEEYCVDNQDKEEIENLDTDNCQTENTKKDMFIFTTENEEYDVIQTIDARDGNVYKIKLNKEGKIFIELNGNNSELLLNEKAIYAKMFNNENEEYFSLLILTKENNIYEYIVSNYKKNDMTVKLLKENVTNLIDGNVPGEYEYPSSYITKIIAFTENKTYEEIKLTKR